MQWVQSQHRSTDVVATRSAYQAAVDRAGAFGGARMIAHVSRDRRLYKVWSTSRAGLLHTVTVDRFGELHCTCEAGCQRNPQPCLHCGAVWLQRVAQGIQYRPTAVNHGSHGASAPLAERSGLGMGMWRRWADDDDRPTLDLLAATA